MKKLLFLFSGVICLSFAAAQEIDLSHYFVDTAGGDLNAGTKEEPFMTIGKGISRLQAGDTLTIMGGVSIVKVSKGLI